jgi:ketosteroid isomerase-like protein
VSKQNVEIVRAAAEAWNRNDFAAWSQAFDPAVQWFALLEEFCGHEGIRRAWQSFKAFELTARFDDFRDLGDRVLALGELTGRGGSTRLNLSNEIAQLVTLRDGKILTYRDFASHADGLKAAGLRK